MPQSQPTWPHLPHTRARASAPPPPLRQLCRLSPAQACRHGHLPLAKLLLRRGGDAGLGDCRGDTPAHLAARQGHLDLLSAMLQAGASRWAGP